MLIKAVPSSAGTHFLLFQRTSRALLLGRRSVTMTSQYLFEATSSLLANQTAGTMSTHRHHHYPDGRVVKHTSAAMPVALIALCIALIVLLQAVVRSFLPASGRIRLRGSNATPAASSSTQPDVAAVTKEQQESILNHANDDVPKASAYHTLSELRMAEAALGKPVDLEGYRIHARDKLAKLALVSSVAVALAAGHFAWVVSAHPQWKDVLAEQGLHASLWLFVLLLIIRRRAISTRTLASSLTTATIVAFLSQLLTLVINDHFAIFPELNEPKERSEERHPVLGASVAHIAVRITKFVPAAISSIPFTGVFSPSSAASPLVAAWRQKMPATPSMGDSSHMTFYLSLLSLLFSFVGFMLASTLRLGPRRVYQPTPDAAPHAMIDMGISGGESILYRLTHYYMTPIIFFAKRNGGLEGDDLPYLHPEMRAIAVFGMLRAQWSRFRAEGTKDGKPSTPLMLLKAILATGKSELTLLMSIIWASAALFYAPAFSINRFVSVFERAEKEQRDGSGPGVRDLRTGVVWALAIMFVSFSQNILFGICLKTAHVSLRSKLKQAVITTLFDKTLRRQEISGGTSATMQTGAGKEKGLQSSATGTETEPAVEETNGSSSDTSNKNHGQNGKKDDKTEDAEEGEEDDKFASKAAIMTLVSNDSERIADVAIYAFTAGLAPFEIAIGFTYVFVLLGWGALVGLLSSLMLYPLIHVMAKLNSRYQDRLMKARDQRVTYLNEAIEAIRMIKFSAWERNVMDRILLSRRKELNELLKKQFCEVGNEVISAFSPILVIIVAFFWSVLVDGKKMTPSTAFTAIAVLNELRFALIELPSLIQSFIELWVSIKRVHKFLELPEIERERYALKAQAASGTAASASGSNGKRIELQNASISWPVFAEEDAEEKKKKKQGKKSKAAAVIPAEEAPKPAPPFKLTNLSTKFEEGKVNLICGKVGSGKSMLILGLLGELQIDSGNVICPHSSPDALGGPLTAPTFIKPSDWVRSDLVAYVPQTAWLVNSSLRENITWGLPMDEERYKATLDACALLPDLAVLEDGDLTDIGEQGIGLSGGQKTRVSLARAVYSRAQLLFLDSPLSNVDAHTANHIHDELLRGPLLAGRTIILVSHQVAMLAPTAAKVVLLEGGTIVFDGSSDDFLHSDHYTGLLEDLKDEEEAEPELAAADANASLPASGTATPTTSNGGSTSTPATSKPPSVNEAAEEPKKDTSGVLKKARKMMSEEGKARGAVKWTTYRKWVDSAGGWKLFAPVLFFFLVYAAWDLVTNLWLRNLTADAGRKVPTHPATYWLAGYAGLLGFSSVLKGIAYLSLYLVSLKASHTLFEQMLDACFRASLRTHDTIPKGRFLNRFSSDFESNDNMLPYFFAATTTCFLSAGVGLIAVVISGGANFLWIMLVVIPVMVWAGSLYRTATRDLRRLQSVAKSPVTSAFSDLLSGVVVVRAFGSSSRMMANVLEKADNAIRFNWLLALTSRWMVCIFQLCSAIVVFAGNMAMLHNLNTTAASAGFAASFLVTTDFLLAWGLMCISNFEQQAVSTERIIEYMNLPQEPAAIIEPGPPDSWPESGSIEIDDLEIKYAPELPTILKGITLNIPGKQKIGVVGKTGCGKSTLASAFFRFVEPTSGSIKIDGINISSVGLEQLRSRLTIVPQDPVILSGVLREAVDPFNEYEDVDVVRVLKEVRLIPADEAAASKSPFSDLKYAIAEGGSNLSGGERQLLCLARALLRNCRVVFFDEASSALDTETDTAIAATIRKSFANATVLTIAHRLRTIADLDYILVMDKGHVVEFDKPIRLIDDPNSRYHKLCKAAGRAEFKELRELALSNA